jgi:hypothetical protein
MIVKKCLALEKKLYKKDLNTNSLLTVHCAIENATITMVMMTIIMKKSAKIEFNDIMNISSA